MKKRYTGRHYLLLTAIILFIIMTVSACNKTVEMKKDAGAIDLTYKSMPVVKLKQEKPGETLTLEKTIPMENVGGYKTVDINLYSRASTTTPGAIEVLAFVVDGEKVYNIGVVSRYGIDDVTVEANDWNHDKRTEVNISGSVGTTIVQLHIVDFDKKSKGWVNLLTLDGPNFIDLDADGVEELVAVSAGSTPTYVSLVRWKKNHFEAADIAKSTNNTYANIRITDETVQLEAGKELNGAAEKHFYQYKDGYLLETKIE